MRKNVPVAQVQRIPDRATISPRTTAFLIALFIFLPAASGMAQGPNGRSFGVGLVLGEPTGVTLRFWQSRLNSWDAAIGTSNLGNPQIHADYLWHFPDAFSSNIVSMYLGVGGIVGFGEKGRSYLVKYKGHDYWWYTERDHELLFALKGVVALDIIPRRTPLDIFLELDPVLGVVPGFGFDMQFAVGIRFYP